jgi:hypothetical protein
VALEAAAAEVTNTDAAAVSDMRDYQMHMLHSLRQIKGEKLSCGLVLSRFWSMYRE